MSSSSVNIGDSLGVQCFPIDDNGNIIKPETNKRKNILAIDFNKLFSNTIFTIIFLLVIIVLFIGLISLFFMAYRKFTTTNVNAGT